jgi:hypothetical protein
MKSKSESASYVAGMDINKYIPFTFQNIIDMPKGPIRDEWIAATKKEINQLEERQIFSDPIPNFHGRSSTSRMVYDIRTDQEGKIKRKARLAVRGFDEIQELDYFDKSNNPVNWQLVLIFFQICAQHQIIPSGYDVTQAFAHGVQEVRKFIEQPLDLNDWKSVHVELMNTLYGQKNAGKQWERLVELIAAEAGLTKSEFSPSTFFKRERENFLLMIIYVDDILIMSTLSEWETHVIETFKKRVSSIRKAEEFSNYLGVHISTHYNEKAKDGRKISFKMDQARYIDSIDCNVGDIQFHMKEENSSMAIDYDQSKALAQEGEKKYNTQSVVGSARFFADRTRPELLATLGILSQHTVDVSSYQVKALQRFMRYAKCTKDKISIHIKNDTCWEINTYTDAAFLINHKSQSRGAYAMYLNFKSSPFYSKSWKIKEVATSTMQAELIPIVKASQTLAYYHDVLKELGIPVPLPGIIYTDNQAIIDTIKSDQIMNGSRHFLMRINYIRQMKDKGIIKLIKVSGEENPADIMTKQLNPSDTKFKTDLLINQGSEVFFKT